MTKTRLFISLSGMSGSGKTTLLNILEKHYKENPNDLKVGFMSEGARSILGEMPELDLSKYRASNWSIRKSNEAERTQYELWQSKLCNSFRDKLDYMADCDVVISDRCFFDQLVYYKLQCNDETSSMFTDIYKLHTKILAEFDKTFVMLTDPSLNRIVLNLHSEPHHHYTEHFSDLVNEKSLFLKEFANLPMDINKFILDTNNLEESKTQVITLIDKLMEDTSNE